MKQGRITAAYKTLAKLNKIPGLPFGLCNRLYLKKHELEPYYNSQAEQEQVILDASGQEHVDITPEIRKAFYEITETDVEYEENPVEVVLTDELAEKLGVTGEMIETLEGFVKFSEVE